MIPFDVMTRQPEKREKEEQDEIDETKHVSKSLNKH